MEFHKSMDSAGALLFFELRITDLKNAYDRAEVFRKAGELTGLIVHKYVAADVVHSLIQWQANISKDLQRKINKTCLDICKKNGIVPDNDPQFPSCSTWCMPWEQHLKRITEETLPLLEEHRKTKGGGGGRGRNNKMSLVQGGGGGGEGGMGSETMKSNGDASNTSSALERCVDVHANMVSGDRCKFFSQVIGMPQVKSQITNNFIEPLRMPCLFGAKGKSILLYGPPGTGKSFIVESAITELQAYDDVGNGQRIRVLFFNPLPGELKGKFVGETEKNIAHLFECASAKATHCYEKLCEEERENVALLLRLYQSPDLNKFKDSSLQQWQAHVHAKFLDKDQQKDDSKKRAASELARFLKQGKLPSERSSTVNVFSVMFIDEFENIAKDREIDEHSAPGVNTLLQMMQGVSEIKNVVLFAATNKPWQLDSAILSRIPLQILVGLPTREDAVDLLQNEIGAYWETCMSKHLKNSFLPSTNNCPAVSESPPPPSSKSTSTTSTTSDTTTTVATACGLGCFSLSCTHESDCPRGQFCSNGRCASPSLVSIFQNVVSGYKKIAPASVSSLNMNNLEILANYMMASNYAPRDIANVVRQATARAGRRAQLCGLFALMGSKGSFQWLSSRCGISKDISNANSLCSLAAFKAIQAKLLVPSFTCGSSKHHYVGHFNSYDLVDLADNLSPFSDSQFHGLSLAYVSKSPPDARGYSSNDTRLRILYPTCSKTSTVNKNKVLFVYMAQSTLGLYSSSMGGVSSSSDLHQLLGIDSDDDPNPSDQPNLGNTYQLYDEHTKSFVNNIRKRTPNDTWADTADSLQNNSNSIQADVRWKRLAADVVALYRLKLTYNKNTDEYYPDPNGMDVINVQTTSDLHVSQTGRIVSFTGKTSTYYHLKSDLVRHLTTPTQLDLLFQKYAESESPCTHQLTRNDFQSRQIQASPDLLTSAVTADVRVFDVHHILFKHRTSFRQYEYDALKLYEQDPGDKEGREKIFMSALSKQQQQTRTSQLPAA